MKKRPKDNVKLLDEIIRINPFLITDRELSEQGTYNKKYVSDGNGIVVYGKLYAKDRDVFIAILSLIGETTEEVELKITDIGRAMRLKNPHDKLTIKRIKESIDRLLKTKLKLYLREKSGNYTRINITLLQGNSTAQDNNIATVSIADYMWLMKELNWGYFYTNTNTYFDLNSSIARSLYLFLNSQRFFTTGKASYKVGLDKLCRFINYTPNSPIRKKRQIIKNQLETLKSKGIIDDFNIDIKQCSEQNGLIKIEKGKTVKNPKTHGKRSKVTCTIIEE